MLKTENTVLLVVDIQGKLAQLMHEKEILFENTRKLIRGIKVLKIPIVWIEQNPAGLGPTVPEIAELMSDIKPISKFSFSCCKDEGFMCALKAARRKQVLVAGIETHVCIYQTAAELKGMGYEVQVVADAVSSRTAANREIALTKMRDAGIGMTSVEMALFELLGVAEGEQFKQILKIVK